MKTNKEIRSVKRKSNVSRNGAGLARRIIRGRDSQLGCINTVFVR